MPCLPATTGTTRVSVAVVTISLPDPRDPDDPMLQLDWLEAVADAAARGPCPDCGISWRPLLLAGTWVTECSHRDSCPAR